MSEDQLAQRRLEAKRRKAALMRENAMSKRGAIGDVVASVGGGFNRGLKKGVGGLVDLTASGINLALPEEYEITDPIGGTQSIQRGYEAVGLNTDTPNELVGRIFEEVGAASIGYGIGGGVARGTATGGKYLAPILESFRSAPKSTAAAELSGAVSAGYGGFLGSEISGGSPGAEFAGEVIGGVLNPAELVRKGATKLVKGAAKQLDPILPGGAKRQAANKLQELVGDPQAVARQLEAKDIPGTKLTPAQKTQNVGLQRLEKAYTSVDTDVAEGVEVARKQTEKALREEAGDIARRGGTREYLQGRIDAVSQKIDDRIGVARQRATDVVRDLGSKDPKAREMASRAARHEIELAFDDLKGVVDEKWAAVDKSEKVSVKPLKALFKKIKDSLSKAEREDLPAVAEKLLGDKGLLQDIDTVGEIQGLRSKLLQEARNSRAGDTPNLHKASIADELAGEIINIMDSDTASDNLIIAIRATNELKDKFSKGAVGSIRKLSRTGAKDISASTTLDEIVKPGAKGAANFDEYVKATGGRPESIAPVKEYVSDQFIYQATENGKLIPSAARTFIKNNRELLNRMPDVKMKIDKAIKTTNISDNIESTLIGRKRSLMDGRKSRATMYLKGKVEEEIKTVLSSKNPAGNMAEIVKQAKKDPTGRALEGLKAQYIDTMLETPNIAAFHDAQKKVVNVLFDKSEINRLNGVISTYKKVDPRFHKAIKLQDEPNAMVDLLSRIVGANIGAQAGSTTGSGLVVAHAGSKHVRRITEKIPLEKTRDVIAEAVLSQDAMKDLLLKINTKVKADEVTAKMNAWMINLVTDDESTLEQKR